MSSTAEYSFQARSTIDVSTLKSSRFLLPKNEPPLLPYRNAEGAIVLCLLEESVAKIKSGAVQVAPELEMKADKWLKHCRKQQVGAVGAATTVTPATGTAVPKVNARVPPPAAADSSAQRERRGRVLVSSLHAPHHSPSSR